VHLDSLFLKALTVASSANVRIDQCTVNGGEDPGTPAVPETAEIGPGGALDAIVAGVARVHGNRIPGLGAP